MPTTGRQNSLLVNQDWTRIYTTFKNADFTSYDFETLRKTMIDYLRLYYPEDFNDYVESSEFIALIDLIAFMGQSLAFRTDINARENFLDTAERRDSILKLARLISYNPKRNIQSSGLLKFTSVSTTETLTDSNGLNLANTPISWNDVTNYNWQEQFNVVLNAAFIDSQVVGKPGNTQTINGIENSEYSINTTASQIPAFPFSATVQNSTMNFEAVSATSTNQPYIYEVAPAPVSRFNVLYRNDNQGNGSINTGFFLYFKQGSLQSSDFSITDAIPNRVLSVGYNNINNSDVWLYDLNTSLIEHNLWTSVPAVAGINVIYNQQSDRNLYQVTTTAGDQINLVFGDGSFANVPQGNYRLYFRTSNGQTYKITPDEIQNTSIAINYVSRAGNVETLTIRASLNYTVTNATVAESIDDIRQKAPQQYYTQNRMITGEDYNIFPYTSFSDILKVKALNRTSSGVSRYIDVSDTSGKYSSTNIFAQDGYLYSNNTQSTLNITFKSTSNIQQLVQDDLTTILNSKEMEHFYFDSVQRIGMIESSPYNLTNVAWHLSSLMTNSATGYFTSSNGNQIIQVGSAPGGPGGNTKYIDNGALLKFSAAIDPTTAYFNAQNQIVQGTPSNPGDQQFLYATVMQVIGYGTNGGVGNFADGTGPVILSQNIPSAAQLYEVIPVFNNSLTSQNMSDITNKILVNNSFGLRYDPLVLTWSIVLDANTDYTSSFSYAHAGDNSSGHLDASWLVRFQYNIDGSYTIIWRSLFYVFGSQLETTFYFDPKVKVFDSSTGLTIRDVIKVLKVNPQPVPNSRYSLGLDYSWNVYSNIVGIDGFQDQHNVLVTFTDTNADGVPDNPDIFRELVNQTYVPPTNGTYPYVFLQQDTTYGGFISYLPITASSIVTIYGLKVDIIPNLQLYNNGQVFFATDPRDLGFYQLVITNGKYNLIQVYNYLVQYGRQDLYFQYRHNSPNYRRIDPSPNNIIDLYLLTNAYALDYTKWIQDSTNTVVEPTPPTTDELSLSYGTLNNSKAISDTIIFNSAVFKPLFGNKANPALQATFKVVKNAALNISDNDIKTSVISAINTYFAINNWDFGEAFYFSELSAYLHTALSPNVSSIIIVPTNPNAMFGSLYQVNAEANEIMASAATVNNVEIISAITASQINANLASANSIVLGTVI